MRCWAVHRLGGDADGERLLRAGLALPPPFGAEYLLRPAPSRAAHRLISQTKPPESPVAHDHAVVPQGARLLALDRTPRVSGARGRRTRRKAVRRR
jgi:hypothetical protein